MPSYADIIDTIVALARGGHINLVETFAERIAEQVLADRRISVVRVALEKLDAVQCAALKSFVRQPRRQRASSAVAEQAARGGRPLVVKVGGSLAETGRLRTALSMIGAARIPVVVVPGRRTFCRKRPRAATRHAF